MRFHRLLSILLWLIALHSFIVGLCLITFSPALLNDFGYQVSEKFFAVQGGVFHIVLVVAYVMAAVDVGGSEKLIWLAITAKFIATVFLSVYFFLVKPIPVVLVSGIGDFLMGISLLLLFLNLKREKCF
jgi:hypothetical protein